MKRKMRPRQPEGGLSKTLKDFLKTHRTVTIHAGGKEFQGMVIAFTGDVVRLKNDNRTQTTHWEVPLSQVTALEYLVTPL